MSLNLTPESDLAAEWKMELVQVRLLRRRHGWPHVRFSRQDIRYTDEQIQQIVRDMTVRGTPPPATAGSGLTDRSRAAS